MDCPACGGPVSLDVGADRPLSTSLAEAILGADEDECVEATRNCWDCGWNEERRVRIESIDTTEGEDTAIKRAALIDEITDELSAIDSVATLEDLRAEISRQRRLSSSTTDTDEDTTE